MTYENLIDLLPYHFQNGKNIQIIFKALYQLYAESTEIINDLNLIGDVYSTEFILDLTGSIVNEYRQGETDELFRHRIIAKILSSISGGDIETINGLGNVLLGNNYIGVLEKWNQQLNPSPAALTLVYNYSSVSQSPISTFKKVLAGGISMDTAIQAYAPIMDFYDPAVTNIVQFPILVQP